MDKITRMKAEERIIQLVIHKGSPESVDRLWKHSISQLGESSDSRTPVEKELAEASEAYRVSLAQSQGEITPTMEEMDKRIAYLKVLKKLGRATDG